MWFGDVLWQASLLSPAGNHAPSCVLDGISMSCFQGSFSRAKELRIKGSPIARVTSDLSLFTWLLCDTGMPSEENELASGRTRFDHPLIASSHPGLWHLKTQVM